MTVGDSGDHLSLQWSINLSGNWLIRVKNGTTDRNDFLRKTRFK
jgi:hypothetical protein